MSHQSDGKEARGNVRRIPRVEREIREVIGVYLLTGFRGDLPPLVSISRVIASKDIRQAKVMITVMGEEGEEKTKAKKAAIRELTAHAYEIQHEVNRKLRMRHCPRLTFLYDEGFDHSLKVENILRKLEAERIAAGAATTSSSNDPSSGSST